MSHMHTEFKICYAPAIDGLSPAKLSVIDYLITGYEVFDRRLPTPEEISDMVICRDIAQRCREHNSYGHYIEITPEDIQLALPHWWLENNIGYSSKSLASDGISNVFRNLLDKYGTRLDVKEIEFDFPPRNYNKFTCYQVRTSDLENMARDLLDADKNQSLSDVSLAYSMFTDSELASMGIYDCRIRQNAESIKQALARILHQAEHEKFNITIELYSF